MRNAIVGKTALADEEIHRDIVERILARCDPEAIVLFGSRARGEARPQSDYDILVVERSSLPRYRRSAPLYAALAPLAVEVEVVVYTPEEVAEWSKVPSAFATRALREGIVLYERRG